jgi:hypothetical protein
VIPAAGIQSDKHIGDGNKPEDWISEENHCAIALAYLAILAVPTSLKAFNRKSVEKSKGLPKIKTFPQLVNTAEWPHPAETFFGVKFCIFTTLNSSESSSSPFPNAPYKPTPRDSNSVDDEVDNNDRLLFIISISNMISIRIIDF